MIPTVADRANPAPPQPMGWPSNVYRNAAIQARQAAEAQRRRADQRARRTRRLRTITAWALIVLYVVGLTLLILGLVVGYAAGVGLIRLVGR